MMIYSYAQDGFDRPIVTVEQLPCLMVLETRPTQATHAKTMKQFDL